MVLSEQDLQALAQHCSHLESLDLEISSSEQLAYFEGLLPSWSHLAELGFPRLSIARAEVSDDDLVRIVKKSPSLKTLSFDVSERLLALSGQLITPEVIEKLAALNRPFTLNIPSWYGCQRNEAQRNELIRRYPHIKVVIGEFQSLS